MKIVISSGHGKYVRGAEGFIDEVNEARRVVEEVAAYLQGMGMEAITYHDDVSTTQNENLNRIVDFHNAQSRDLDVSVHFNAYETTEKAMGTECLYVTQSQLADDVAARIAGAGHLIDRGPKKRTDLFFLNNTEEPAILIEVCFVDSGEDVDHYNNHFEAICEAIAEAISGEDQPPQEANMANINRKVLDISHHNDVTSWDSIVNAGIVGIIHKATEGTSYVDDMYLSRCAPAMRAGLVWGAYHFANGSDIPGQVNHFLNVVGVDNETLYALDWEEDPNGNTMNAAEAKQFLQLIGERIGMYRCVVYSGNTAKEALGSTKDEFFGKHRLWLAQYASSGITVQNSWDDCWIWQYSDGNVGPGPHGCPGVSGDVDTNSWGGTDDELRNEWTGAGPAPAPTPDQGLFTASGKCSWFGGPNDTGVAPDEGLAFIYSVDDAPHLFSPTQPRGTTGLARQLNPNIFYVACRWDYNKTPKKMLVDPMLQALVKAKGKEFWVWPADWGPNESTGRVADLSPGLLVALGLKTDDEVEIVYPATQGQGEV